MLSLTKRMRGLKVGALALLSLVLTSCGGGGVALDDGIVMPPAYTLGGSVTGVPDGQVLELRNNNATPVTVTGDATFVFPGSLLAGSAYAVTVTASTIPAGYRCTVGNGSGEITADITDVDVRCVPPPKHTLGGTLSGLPDGQSLQLQNNGADPVTVASNGAFSLGSFFEGTTYAVTTASSIPGFDCQVGSGTGTLGADVTNVTVDCRRADFRVGGTLTGLPSGRSLQLADNGSDLRTLTANGAFAFDGLLSAGGRYAVTVRTGIAGYECAVRNGVGAVNGADVGDVAVVCAAARSWGAPGLVENTDVGNGGSGNANTPKVAFDARGNAIATWRQYANDEDGNYDTMVNRFDAAAGAWNAELQIDSDSLAAINQGIAVDPTTGNALVVWQEGATNPHRLSRLYTAASGWTAGSWAAGVAIEAAGSTNSSNGNTGGNVNLAFDPGGNAIAVWYANDGSTQSVYAGRYSAATGAWGTAQLIETGTRSVSTQDDPQIAVDARGDAIAVWTQYDGVPSGNGVFSIYANRYDAGTGTWGAGARELSSGSRTSNNPRVAVDGQGNAIVVWQQTSEETGTGINAVRYVAGTGWDTAVTLVGDSAAINGTAGNVFRYSPQVAFDAAGNATVMWVGSDNSIHARRRAATLGWEAVAGLVADGTGTPATMPQLAVDADGNALAVWLQANTGSSGNGVWASRYVPGTGWAAPQSIDTSTTATNPRIAMDAQGNAIAVWSQNKGTPSQTDIWYARFH